MKIWSCWGCGWNSEQAIALPKCCPECKRDKLREWKPRKVVKKPSVVEKEAEKTPYQKRLEL